MDSDSEQNIKRQIVLQAVLLLLIGLTLTAFVIIINNRPLLIAAFAAAIIGSAYSSAYSVAIRLKTLKGRKQRVATIISSILQPIPLLVFGVYYLVGPIELPDWTKYIIVTLILLGTVAIIWAYLVIIRMSQQLGKQNTKGEGS